MDSNNDKLPRVKRILYFFPIQLFLLHFKRNPIVLAFWVALFGFTTGLLGEKYGIAYLFLAPEYLGEINALSFLIFGFSCGGFIMAFNIYSYIMHAHKFRFIATVARPFYKFCLNNSIIPIIFILVFVFNSIRFQAVDELIPSVDILINIVSFIIGCILFFVISLFYFFRTNKDIIKLNGTSENGAQSVKSKWHNTKKWYDAFRQDQEWHVHYYIAGFKVIRLARDAKHYDQNLIKRVLSQNSINATYFELIVIISFVLLGTFKEYDWIRVPAGASIMLLFTFMLMFISILSSWLKGWMLTTLVLFIVMLNWATNQTDFLRFKNYAYGMNYETSKALYDRDNIAHMTTPEMLVSDYEKGIERLENWKARQGEEKPILFVVNCSGGGLRSSIWTFQVLQELDKTSNGAFLEHTAIITGSSGGMIGAAYYRELALQDVLKQTNERFSGAYKDRLSKDLLNSVAFTIATSDLFPRIQSFKDGDYRYTKDRGYMFEKNLDENTNHVLDKRLKDYTKPEYTAQIPMMIFAPTIVTDGKRLLISAQPISYMCESSNGWVQENIEFTKLFKDQDANNLKFTSALRMNATFPYVLPMVTLPSDPSIEIMDAGLRDNYGVKDAVKYLSTFEDWIKENTAKVVFIQIRDRKKSIDIEHQASGSLLRRVFTPFSNVYGNVLKTQDYTNDQLMQEFLSHFNHPVLKYSFDLMTSQDEQISLNWHLTAKEKRNIDNALYVSNNHTFIESISKLVVEE